MMHQPKHHPDRITQMVGHLRRSPGSRAVLYLVLEALTLEAIIRSHDKTNPYELVSIHLTTAPFATTVTYLFLRYLPQEQLEQSYVPTRQDMDRLLQGIGFGSGALLTYVGVLKATDWGSLPVWGWEETSLKSVCESVAINGLGHLAVAWNEELVFRGYGFDTLRQAWGTTSAAAFMIVLFALAHKWTWLSFVGQSALGLALTAIRLRSGTIWMPIGYHWFWNYLQSGIFGSTDATPSVRPLRVHGPRRWTGRPGHPDPGLLSMCIHLSVALAFGLSWWRQQRKR
ncbi:MAG: CPBP family intramembrane glutamic endopeptidase [Chloroflexota bacterium]